MQALLHLYIQILKGCQMLLILTLPSQMFHSFSLKSSAVSSADRGSETELCSCEVIQYIHMASSSFIALGWLRFAQRQILLL